MGIEPPTRDEYGSFHPPGLAKRKTLFRQPVLDPT